MFECVFDDHYSSPVCGLRVPSGLLRWKSVAWQKILLTLSNQRWMLARQDVTPRTKQRWMLLDHWGAVIDHSWQLWGLLDRWGWWFQEELVQ